MLSLLKKKKKNYVRLQGLQAQGAFSNKITPDIYGFTEEPVVQCDGQVV